MTPRVDGDSKKGRWVAADVKEVNTKGPVLIHVRTEKGRGYAPAEAASDRMHGVGKYDVLTGKQVKLTSKVGHPCDRLVTIRHCSSYAFFC